MRFSINYIVPVTCNLAFGRKTYPFSVAEIAEAFADDDAFSSPPFASGFGREDEDGPSGPPPFGTDEPPPPPPPSFKSKLPTSGFRDSQQPRVRRPRRPRPSYPTVGGGSGSGGGGDDLDDYLCHPPLCHPPPPPPIPPSTAAAALPSSSHFPLPPASTPLLHDEHNRDGRFGTSTRFEQQLQFQSHSTQRMISQSRSSIPTHVCSHRRILSL